MKIREVTFDKPKDRKAALNLSAYIYQQQLIYRRKETNLMSQISQTEEKLKRLQETLENYKIQISEVNKNSDNWKQELQRLQNDFQITQAEILETHSELLRKQISSLQKNAGVLDTDKTTLN